MLFKVTLLVLNFITASYKQRYFPFYERNEENPTFGALTELRSCARNLGVNIVKFSTGIDYFKFNFREKSEIEHACDLRHVRPEPTNGPFLIFEFHRPLF